jgi:ADP-ribose pyrophosphatase YjhB (NUDIX family)
MGADPPTREYPDAPRVGVGAVVLDGDRVLLVRRGGAPSPGKWSIPGGLVQLGERIEDAVRRELREECSLEIRLLGVCGAIDRVVPGPAAAPDGRPTVRYHYVIVDYAAVPVGGTLCAGSDAAEACFVPVADLARYETTDGLADMVHRAVRLYQVGNTE